MGRTLKARAASVEWPWALSAIAAAAFLFVAFFLPLWSMSLLAPQYPAGLELSAYGTRMEGDLAEINALNHYIGVAPLEPDSMVELKLFPFLLFPAVAGLAVAAFVGVRRWLRVAAAIAVWTFPLGLLVDMQYWLYTYGHDLNPSAPIRVEGFTPKVLGNTKVLNFHSETMVSSGFWMMVAAAVMVTIGPALLRFLWTSWNTTESGRASATFALLLGAGAIAVVIPMQVVAKDTPLTINAMIEAAEPGARINVPAGHYQEQLVITKSVELIGEGRPVIDGGGKGDVVVIAAENVTLRGFVVEHSARDVSGEPTGVRVTANSATVEDNQLRQVLYGIVLQDSDRHTIRGNSITSMMEFSAERRGHGLYLWHTAGNTVSDNRVDGAKDGIFVGFGTGNLIEHNTIMNVRYGIHYMYSDDNVFRGNLFTHNVAGAALMYSRKLTLEDNEFSYNRSAASGYGLLMKDVDDVVMSGNRIFQNRIGLTMEGAPQAPGSTVVIRDNFIGHNQVAVELFTNTAALFTGNTFAGNLRQVQSRGGNLAGKNTWDLEGRGNYWDDYRGYDADGDGIGDRGYSYAGAFNDLATDEPSLQAFAFTPAQTALDLAANWFSSYKPDPAVVDAYPLMSPGVSLGQGRSWTAAWMLMAAMLPLIAVPIGVFHFASKSFRGEPVPC